MGSDELEKVRIDKWLWAVRIYKTRTLATEACKAGSVKIEGTNTKPSRDLKIGEVIKIRTHNLTKTVKVVGLIDRRIGAKLVPEYLEDLTPKEEYERLKEKRENSIWREAETNARPTKKDRRALDKFKS